MTYQIETELPMAVAWMEAPSMFGNAIQQSPSYPVTRELFERGYALVEQCQEAGVDARPAGIQPLFTGRHLIEWNGQPFAAMPYSEHPYIQQGRKLPAPKHVRDDIAALKRADVETDALYIVEELPQQVLETGYISDEMLEPPPSKEMRERSAKYGQYGRVAQNAAATTLGVTAGIATLPLAVAGIAFAGALAAAEPAMAIGSALISLDPILLAAVVDKRFPVRRGTPAAMIMIAHWYWE